MAKVLGQPKKVKIVSVTPNIKNGEHQKDPKGNFRHWAKFEGEDVQYGISTKDESHSSWVAGAEVTIIPGTWTSDDGTTKIHFASLERKNSPYGGGGGFKPKGMKEYLAEGVLVAARVAGQVVAVKDKPESGDFDRFFKASYNVIKGEITSLFSE